MSDVSLEGHLHRLCGGRYAPASERVTLRLSGMSAQVERAFYRCSKCGDEQRTVEQREAAEQAAVAAMRAAHALLAPREIKVLRESLGLTPQQLGDLLYGTPRGVVEGWEKGRYLQNRETDALLRSLTDRETLELRAAKAGVALPDPALLAAAPSPWARRGRGAGAARAATGPGEAPAAEAPAANGAGDVPDDADRGDDAGEAETSDTTDAPDARA
jgi:DNA-binding transcriptional regulator YiaG